MPICPGCEKRVPYNRLDIHERYCKELTDQPDQGRVEALDRRLRAIEQQLNRRMVKLESRLQETQREQGQDSAREQQYRR